MNKGKKRFLSALMAACMAATMLPAAAAAEDEPVRGELQYEQVIAPQYEDAQLFNEGLAAVKKDGKWGYINESGEVVIPFQYDVAGQFSEGHAIVGRLLPKEEDDWYDRDRIALNIIDKNGNERPILREPGEQIINHHLPVGDSLPDSYIFHNGYAQIEDIFFWSNILISVDTATTAVQYGYSRNLEGPVNEGMAILTDLDGDYGYLNLETQQELRIKNSGDKYRYTLFPFNQGLAPVWRYSRDENGNQTPVELGFIDKTGKWVIQPQPGGSFAVRSMYDFHQVFSDNGIAMIKSQQNGKYGGINKQGQTVIPFVYDSAYSFNNGLAPAQQNGKWGHIDETGKWVIAPAYDQVTNFNGDGYALVVQNGEGILIDRKGNRIPGQDKIDTSNYFTYNDDGSSYVYDPTEMIVIGDEGNYGYARVTYNPPLPEQSEVSGWAFEEVTAAIEENLVPNYLQNQYRTSINRAEFCNLTVQAVTETAGKDVETLVQEKTGKSLDTWVQERPFNDETDENVIAAYALGIVNGRGEGAFDPYTKLNRQEAAAFLMRAANVLGMDTGTVSSAGYADEASIATWFRDAVNYVSQIGVMNGMGDNSFSPLSGYTREQSYMTIYRLFEAYNAE